MSSPGKRTVGRGQEYYDYLKSDAWKDVKRRYLASKLPKDCYRHEIVCTGCGENVWIAVHHGRQDWCLMCQEVGPQAAITLRDRPTQLT
jgi:hypothetical protein